MDGAEEVRRVNEALLMAMERACCRMEMSMLSKHCQSDLEAPSAIADMAEE